MCASAPPKKFQIIITVIGPGEISSWLFPLIRVLKNKRSDVNICVTLLPSVFRAGAEVEVLKSMPEIDVVLSIKEFRQLMRRGIFPAGLVKDLPGCVLHMGGEPGLSHRLASRLQYPLFFYGEKVPRSLSRFDKVYLSDEHLALKKRKQNKVQTVGNLMVDAAFMRCPERKLKKSGGLTIGLFPGSRYYQVKHMLPFYMQIARLASHSLEEPTWIVAKSSYLDLDVFAKIVGDSKDRLLEGDNAHLSIQDSSAFLISEHGLRFNLLAPESVMSQADVALCVPGTNTAELAAIGVPMMVLLPTQRPEMYPLPGLAGYLNFLPVVGKYVKIALLWIFWRRTKYLAHPNQKETREIVPEIVGKITPAKISALLIEYTQRNLHAISEELRSVMGARGAAERLSEKILNSFK